MAELTPEEEAELRKRLKDEADRATAPDDAKYNDDEAEASIWSKIRKKK